MMIEFTQEEVGKMISLLTEAARVIEFAQGRAEKYVARRMEWGQILQFPSMKKAPAEAGVSKQNEMDSRGEALPYSQEEIEKMPKLKDGRFRITPDGYYQVRYRKEGYDIQFTSKDKNTVVERFREWVRSVNNERKDRLPKKSENFAEFAERYFMNVKRANVMEKTCNDLHSQYKRHILPVFGKLSIRQVTPMKCQELLKRFLDEGHGRTAETVKDLLAGILRAAVGEKIIRENPMDFVKIPKHLRTTGVDLTKAEIAAFMKACEKSRYRKQLMLFLYTGIRRNEIHSAVFDDGFMTVENGKRRKGQPVTFRSIPLHSKLREFLPLTAEELAVKNDVLTNHFGKLCPGHTLKDLRHTFTTRAQEGGVPKELVDVWTAHVDKKDMTASVYTHFSKEFHLEMIELLDY